LAANARKTRVAYEELRRDINEQLKKMEKDRLLSKDDLQGHRKRCRRLPIDKPDCRESLFRKGERDSGDLKRDVNDLDKNENPVHVAIIMDGNGRWARQRGQPRIEGHIHARSGKEIVTTTAELQIPYLTLYAFSKENWLRPEVEVKGATRLFGLLY
jgi:hypothetical protein